MFEREKRRHEGEQAQKIGHSIFHGIVFAQPKKVNISQSVQYFTPEESISTLTGEEF